jgi:hypothetical protein
MLPYGLNQETETQALPVIGPVLGNLYYKTFIRYRSKLVRFTLSDTFLLDFLNPKNVYI